MFCLHIKQTFPLIDWIFTEDEVDGIKSRLPFKIFSTLLQKGFHHIVLRLYIRFLEAMPMRDARCTPPRHARPTNNYSFQKRSLCYNYVSTRHTIEYIRFDMWSFLIHDVKLNPTILITLQSRWLVGWTGQHSLASKQAKKRPSRHLLEIYASI